MTSFGDISLPEDVEDDADNEDVDMIPLDCVGGGGGGGGGRNRQSILPHSPLLLRYLLHAYAWNSRTVRTFEIKERTSEEHARNVRGTEEDMSRTFSGTLTISPLMCGDCPRIDREAESNERRLCG